MKLFFLDYETYSPTDIKANVYRYCEDREFRVLLLSFAYGDDPVEDLDDQEVIRRVMAEALADPDVLFVAHNAQFERIVTSRLMGLPVGEYLDPERWEDTQALAAEYGLPQKLANLAPALGAEPKDEAGTRLINIFSKPNRKGKRTLPSEKPLDWLDFIDYCNQDVVSLREVYYQLMALGGWPSDTEWQVYLADQHINDRGMRIDVELARAAVAAAEVNQNQQKFELSDATGWLVENANSNPQMMEWVRAEGLPAKNLQAATVSRLLEGDLTDDQRSVLEIRQELALVASKKYAAALMSVSEDERVRGTLKFFGAHTARWSGRGTQVQNLPSQKIELREDDLLLLQGMRDLGLPKDEIEKVEDRLRDAETERIIANLIAGNGASSNELKALVRPMFRVDGVVVDYAAIEARVLAWWCGEEWALEAFRAGRDIYVETAERMSTPTRPLGRPQGKIAVLALGYNGAVNSLRVMGAEGTDDELMVLVKQWRRANAKIVKMWQVLGDAFGETGAAGDYLQVTEGHDALGRSVSIHLPSGRAIGYHGTRWERYKVAHPTIPGKFIPKEGWRYTNAKMPFNKNMRIGTYGGRLAENVTQAIARDIMAEALVRLQREGYGVIGHVHDEILVEGATDIDEIAEIMSVVPDWAAGLPIDGEGFLCSRYKKG